jgi:hypothetical protein
MAVAVGEEWLVDAFECDPAQLGGEAGRLRVAGLFERIAVVSGLEQALGARWHVDPADGGLTGLALFTDAHATCRTFPGSARLVLTLFSGRPREVPEWKALLAEFAGACDVRVRRVVRGLRYEDLAHGRVRPARS